MARPSTIEKQRVASGPDVILFFLALVAGVASILVAKYVLILPQLLITVPPVAVMLLYAAVIWISGRYRLREDQAGDNLYYLGFLYTLTSLALSLIEFDPEAGAANIISNFGIAIFTTIVGIALRVLFNQMRRDPVEIEREARYELAHSARQLRAELDQAAREFTSFRRTMQQQIEEAHTELGKKTATFLEDSLGQFNKVVVETGEEISQGLAALSDHTESAVENAKSIGAAVEDLKNRVAAIDAPADMIEEKFKPAAEAIGEITTALEARARHEEEASNRVRALVEQSLQASGSLDRRLRDALDTLEAVGRAGPTIEEVNARLASVLAGLDNAREIIDSAARIETEGAAARREALDREFGALVEVLNRIRTDLGAFRPSGDGSPTPETVALDTPHHSGSSPQTERRLYSVPDRQDVRKPGQGGRP